MLAKIVGWLERLFFTRRAVVLAVLAVFTVLMAFYATQLRMEAGFEKQMPIGHEYIQTFQQYRSQLFGANRLTIAVKARHGTMWTKAALTRLYDVTEAVTLFPNIDRLGVQSLWTPNTFVDEITPEGFNSSPLIPRTVKPEALNDDLIAQIARTTSNGGFIGTLVAHDQSSALITAELAEYDKSGKKLDYIDYNRLLNEKIRDKFTDADYQIEIIGFAKEIGDIAEGARGVLLFCGISVLLTGIAVYWYCHSVRFTILPIACSLTSLIWQFGTLNLLGFGLDPLAVLVPFLVFSIGVSHGVQQINFIVREIAAGKTTMEAARSSFSGLLIPGTLALVTAFVSFITLILIPIPMVRDLAVTASIGVGYKIVTNLVLLPVVASYFNFSAAYAEKALLKRDRRAQWLRALARVSRPRTARVVALVTLAILAVAAVESRDRVIGTLQPGAPELREDSRYNRDSLDIATNYDSGLDWITVVIEAPKNANECTNVALGKYEDDFSWVMENVSGVVGVSSFTSMMKTHSAGYNEGNPKMAVVPIDQDNFAAMATELMRVRGYVNSDCSMTAMHVYLSDHKATTINAVVQAAKQFREENRLDDIKVRLASGNAGVMAAINEAVAAAELPMMLYVYAAIAIVVLLAYRDLRAVVACCLPLTVATFIGYWFMKELDIGLTVATLPVMVLAVGIGVDYAFYIYNRLQLHLSHGLAIAQALELSIREVGMATIFTALTLAAGVAIWAFSELKFQADMGKLLAFMFIVNLIMAMTALPAFAVVLEQLFPRHRPVRVPGILQH